MDAQGKVKGDELDEFVRMHHRSMSQREMAEATGASKSTVSRRYIALRDAGELGGRPKGAPMGESAPGDRLEALEELIGRLHDELSSTGGGSLARVSAEYRKALEERDALRDELGMSRDNRYRATPFEIARARAFAAEADDPVAGVLAYLAGRGAIVMEGDEPEWSL